MRPVRKLRRWFRSTPTTQVASTMIGSGCVLILVALAIVGVRSGWI